MLRNEACLATFADHNRYFPRRKPSFLEVIDGGGAMDCGTFIENSLLCGFGVTDFKIFDYSLAIVESEMVRASADTSTLVALKESQPRSFLLCFYFIDFNGA
jgi:hypothetical protein